jgi:hypothetical protein
MVRTTAMELGTRSGGACFGVGIEYLKTSSSSKPNASRDGSIAESVEESSSSSQNGGMEESSSIYFSQEKH